MGELRVPVVLLGPGAVGRAFLDALLDARPRNADHGLVLDVVAVIDSVGAVVAAGPAGENAWAQTPVGPAETAGDLGATSPAALTDAVIRRLCRAKSDGDRLGPETARAVGAGWHSAAAFLPSVLPERASPSAGTSKALPASRAVLVDTSASDSEALLVRAAAADWGIVTANKRPLVGSMPGFRAITRAPAGARWETTVAAALPVVATLQGLLDSGDHIRAIRGCVSGTMAFLASRLANGAHLAATVSEAIDLGYAEPDPRDDLSGRDAARKALILARMLGSTSALADVTRQGLYPSAWDELEPDTFMARLPELDANIDLVAGAEPDIQSSPPDGADGLRYVVTIRPRGGAGRGAGPQLEVSARFESLAADDPIRRTRLTDSVVVFSTEHYDANPLVISGRGAGPAITAAGVLADVVSVARSWQTSRISA